METEIWKIIDGYENYEVSSLGKIRNKTRKRLLKFESNKRSGYYSVCLSKNNIKKNFTIHHLVASSFIPKDNLDIRHVVNHKNGIKTDNRVDNLEWVTLSGNCKHALESGLKRIYKKAVLQLDLSGNLLEKFTSILEAERITKVCSKKISQVCLGNRKTTGGYKWKYEEDIVSSDIDLTKFVSVPKYTKYLISEDGLIYSLFSKKVLKSRVSESGQNVVDLCETNKKTWSVARLVAFTFIPNPEDKKHVFHINNIKSDNNVKNLKWM
jgi:hypothetical protein